MRIAACVAAALLLAALGPAGAQGQVRARADVSCASTGELLHYDCTIRLADRRTGSPLAGVTLMIGADMPSMPGMHNVRPVRASEGPDKGTYRARLVLEMHGDWAVRLDLSGPVRDRVIAVLRFEGDHVGDAKRAPERHGH